MSHNSDDKGPYKRKAEGRFDTEKRRPEAEIGVQSCVTSQEHLEPPEPGRVKEGFSYRAFGGTVALLTPEFHFWPPEP